MAAEDYIDFGSFFGIDEEDLAHEDQIMDELSSPRERNHWTEPFDHLHIGVHFDEKKLESTKAILFRDETLGDVWIPKSCIGCITFGAEGYIVDILHGFWKNKLRQIKEENAWRGLAKTDPNREPAPRLHKKPPDTKTPTKISGTVRKPKSQRRKVKTMFSSQHVASLFQETMTTVAVTYGHSDTYNDSQLYVYKIDRGDCIQADDLVLVYAKSSIKVARVREVHESPQLDYESDINYSWVIGAIPQEALDLYEKRMTQEAEFAKLAQEAENQHQRKSMKDKILEVLEGNEEMRERFTNLGATSAKALERKSKEEEETTTNVED